VDQVASEKAAAEKAKTAAEAKVCHLRASP
jgi:hypothetical protein